jgi:hypothetical protein
VFVHQILLAPAAGSAALLAHPRVAAGPPLCGRTPTVRLRAVAEPARRDLMRAVARAFRYPEFLVSGPPELALEYLAARAIAPRFVRLGRFRGRGG